MRTLLTIFILIVSIITASAGEKNVYKFKVTGLKDTTVFLANYYGNKLYYKDTTESKNGEFSFTGVPSNEGGIYAVVLPGSKYFEVILGDEDVKIETKVDNPVPNMNVVSSKNNSVFYDYVKYLGDMKKKADPLRKQLEEIEDKDSKEAKKVKEELNAIDKQVLAYQKQVVTDNKDILIGKIINMGLEVEVPDPPKDENGVIDSTFSYKYYRDHFWDNIDLTDNRMVRSPMFHNKLEKYFTKVIIQHPDSIIKYAEKMISKIEDQEDLFKYTVHFLTYNFETSKIMGMDAVFVHLALKYYCPDENGNSKAYWLKEDKINDICERANKLNPLLLGKKAPYISLTDSTEKVWHNFYDLPQEYVILYFWDPNCGHCKKETPKLKKEYEEKLKGMDVEVFAVAKATGEDFEKWKKFVKDNELEWINVGLTKNIYNAAMKDARQFIPKYTTIGSLNYTDTYDIYSTPRIYIVDKDRMIRGKNVGVEQLEDLIKRLKEEDEKKKADK